ncbi:MAG TPA: hypothetical protein VJ873_04905 [bacterium]|nr:hypothetical protein [bacterium]
MSQPRTHLIVGTPCYGGQVTSLYTTSLMRLQAACAQRGDIDMGVNLLWGDALITRCRQNLVTQFLENSLATHLIFIDADISFDPTQVFRLLDFGVDIAAGVYPAKRIDWAKLEALAKAGMTNLESAALSYVLEFENPQKIETRNGFAKVRYAGTGFMMVRREALLKMIEHYPELRYSNEHQAQDPWKGSKWRSALFNCILDSATGTYLSEDFSFCKRWMDMGGEIWVDLQSRLGHTGTMTFNGNAATQFIAPSK